MFTATESIHIWNLNIWNLDGVRKPNDPGYRAISVMAYDERQTPILLEPRAQRKVTQVILSLRIRHSAR